MYILNILNRVISYTVRSTINYLDQRRRWILKRISKSRLSDALDARKYFGLHIPVSIQIWKSPVIENILTIQ
jgi:hypothetical protein